MISVIDMPGPEESIWWRGKRGFEVGFFPCECVEVIGDKVPQGLTLPHTSNTLPHLTRRNSDQSDSPSEPTKPVLRKHGKLITFFRSVATPICHGRPQHHLSPQEFHPVPPDPG